MKNNSVKFAAKIFKKSEIKRISAVSSLAGKNKIVVFVPPLIVEEITRSMAEKGAGIIGNYTVCSFRVKGTGTFKGGKTSKPAMGTKGKFESVEEIRLEMICEKKYISDVISNMLKHHPYEEPAYEIYDVMTGSKSNGAVRAELKKPIVFSEIIKRINKKLDIQNFTTAYKAETVKDVIIDMTKYDSDTDYMITGKQKILYINKKTNGAINLTLK